MKLKMKKKIKKEAITDNDGDCGTDIDIADIDGDDDDGDDDDEGDDDDDTDAGTDDPTFEFADTWSSQPPAISNPTFETKADVFERAAPEQTAGIRYILQQISENIAKLTPPTPSATDDPDDLLFKFIARSIKDLPPDLKISCRAEMMTVLAKYQQQQLSEKQKKN